MKKILFIDDDFEDSNKTDYSLLCKIKTSLEQKGYSVDVALNNAEALVKLNESISLVVLDLYLPKSQFDKTILSSNGKDILKTIYNKYPSINTIVITGRGVLSDASELVRNGAYDVLGKAESNFEELLLKKVENCKDVQQQKRGRHCSFSSDNVCLKEFKSFLDKKSVFLASSNKFKDNIQEIGKKLTNCIVAPWTKRESQETGIIFSDEVCPKLYGNSTIVADITDFNPNVFFEIGFALGLGRKVIPIKTNGTNKSIQLPLLGNNLYTSYETITDATENIQPEITSIKDIYTTPRIFENISNFDKPTERKKCNVVYVCHLSPIPTEISNCLNSYTNLKLEGNIVEIVEKLINAKAILIYLNGRTDALNNNRINDCELMYLAGVCVAQGVPVKIFQSNNSFYADVHLISQRITSDCTPLINYVNQLPL